MDVVNAISSMVNPFENDNEDLMHIANGLVAFCALADDMKNMLENSKIASINLMKTNIIGKELKIYNKKTNLNSF